MSLPTLISLMIFFHLQLKPILQINVSGISEATGYVMIAVYDSNDTFLTDAVVIGDKIEVTNTAVLSCFLELPLGDYGISIYHDVDGDGELDSSLFKIPTEPTGFSNNPKNFIGPPSFEKVMFSFQKDKQSIVIELN